MRTLLSTVLVLTMGAGIASAQWWNIMESPCEEAVRKTLEVACDERVTACRAKDPSPAWSVEAFVKVWGKKCEEDPAYRNKMATMCAGGDEEIRKHVQRQYNFEKNRMKKLPARCLRDNAGARRNWYKSLTMFVEGGVCELDSNHAKLKAELVLACESGK